MEDAIKSIFTLEHAMAATVAWIVAAAIGALEAPDNTSSKFYRWAFKFLNTLAANPKRAFSAQIKYAVEAPSDQEIKTIMVPKLAGEMGTGTGDGSKPGG